jgi:hypothetical protein
MTVVVRREDAVADGWAEDIPPYLLRRRFVPIKRKVINCTLTVGSGGRRLR